MKKESLRKLLIVTAYAIAMGFFEAAVVIYLRNLFYPNGFNFPLKGFIEPYILSVEWIREIATIIMLITIGMLAGKKFYEKIAYFVYSFAIWDIFYYVFLKMYLNWPSSLLTWDILFMVPWPWVGPVLAPLLCTILMIITTFIIINLFTWMYDYGMLIFNNGFAKDFFTLATNPRFIEVVDNYIPSYFNWPLFLLGLFVSSLGVLLFYIRMKKGKRSR